MARRYNKLVPVYNDYIAPGQRSVGRPIAASEAQRDEVRSLHYMGESLRSIAVQTSLGQRTVRTIAEKAKGTDRTTRRQGELRRLELNRQRMAAYRARKRIRDALPKQITELRKRGDELVKRAGVSRAR